MSTPGSGFDRLRALWRGARERDAGEFNPVGEDGLLQGGIVWVVEGGGGIFDGAKGIITSNFAVDAAGDVVDYHTGVIYLP